MILEGLLLGSRALDTFVCFILFLSFLGAISSASSEVSAIARTLLSAHLVDLSIDCDQALLEDSSIAIDRNLLT